MTTSGGTWLVRRSGATLPELLIALIVLGLIVGTALQFLRFQSRDLQAGAEAADVVQNLRFAIRRLENDLRTLGTNVPFAQPALVYAGENIVAFHADYATHLTDDPFAVYSTPEAPIGEVSAPLARSVTLPGTGVLYPDTTYEVRAGAMSPAELLIFFLVPDSASGDPENHVLYRQVNSGTPEPIARNLRRVDDQPFFRYLTIRDSVGVGLRLDSIPDNEVPVRHLAPIHGSAADSATSALADSIRAIRVTLRSVSVGSDGTVRQVTATRLIGFPNAGLSALRVCGSEPILGTGLTATVTEVDEKYRVELTWVAATDEVGGEADVVRYVLWRRNNGIGAWGDPLRSIPAGQPSYNVVDENVVPGSSYQYALAAQDCTPTLSPLTQSGIVTVPNEEP